MRVSASVRVARLALAAAHGTVRDRPLVLLSFDDLASGLSGYGEAAPLQSYDGVTVNDVLEALGACREVLHEADLVSASEPGARAALLEECARRTALAQALAGIELALLDLAGRAREESAYILLGGRGEAPAIEVNHTIGAVDPDSAAREAASALAAGICTVKVKVGTGEEDAARVRAVRDAGGSGLAIRLDANGAYETAERALAALEELAPLGIELCEEPVHGAAEIAALAESAPVPLALDESAAGPEALARRCAQAICLKIARCGGIGGVVRDGRRARELGYEVYLASTLDGPLGIAAALHAAALLGVDRACGLATLALFEHRADPLPPSGGRIVAPAGPGLGDGLLDWYRALSR
jgi:L-alanine-DL-glutamate epimerase-like enolase superfamily enzyme